MEIYVSNSAINQTKHFVVGLWLPCTEREALVLVHGRLEITRMEEILELSLPAGRQG